MSDSSNTDDNSTLVDMDNLDDFEDAFFSTEPRDFKPEGEDEDVKIKGEDDEVENEEDPLATEEDETQEDEEEDEDPAPQPEKKKSKLQTRIDELVSEARVAQRERDALAAQLRALEARTEGKPEKAPEPTLNEQLPPDAPKPDDVDKDGNELYPLGEFDPKYIAALTRFSVAQEMKAAREEAEKAAEAAKAQAAQQALTAEWTKKVEAAVEVYDDFKESIDSLQDAFRGVEPQYGDFLASTIMQCENGADIMYYLSQNIGEAQKIVASGPFAATFAIAKLQSKFEKPAETKEKSNTKKMSDAPTPPENRSRGSNGRFATAPDTNDLDAFEREFFKSRRR